MAEIACLVELVLGGDAIGGISRLGFRDMTGIAFFAFGAGEMRIEGMKILSVAVEAHIHSNRISPDVETTEQGIPARHLMEVVTGRTDDVAGLAERETIGQVPAAPLVDRMVRCLDGRMAFITEGDRVFPEGGKDLLPGSLALDRRPRVARIAWDIQVRIGKIPHFLLFQIIGVGRP